ncbi:hypothetical protein FDP41_010448 [Naegleria fowleri]|uniref:Uncharacterized protein n=1 Tax=Naegleria fowleri TaxID=5763 RepID=A0A6A5BZ17_NAEFO|nr:uncharacterized protein FDP41_010448 [Naegleria fowleri]KAF0983383.1 hypothetical protein FDP41_010448 [Naegleria fowleri]CAG4709270.1 unnamed protein product [Naegleria fowleri]
MIPEDALSRSKAFFYAFLSGSILTCLAWLCLLIFGIITITNTTKSAIIYNNGAAMIVFACGTFLVWLSMMGGMAASAYMMRRYSERSVVSRTTKPVVYGGVQEQHIATTLP